MDVIVSAVYREVIFRSLQDLTGYLWSDGDVPLLIGLFANDITPTPGMTTASFTAPIYTGYARKEMGGSNPVFSLDPSTGDWMIRPSGLATAFQPSDDTGLPVTVYGWWLTSGDDTTKVMFASRLDEAFTFQSSDNALVISPALTLRAFGLA